MKILLKIGFGSVCLMILYASSFLFIFCLKDEHFRKYIALNLLSVEIKKKISKKVKLWLKEKYFFLWYKVWVCFMGLVLVVRK